MSSRMRQLLLEGLEDHVQLWWLLPDRDDVPNPEARRRDVLQLVEEMLASGWFEVGFPKSNGREYVARFPGLVAR